MKHFNKTKKGNKKMKNIILPISTLLFLTIGCDNPLKENAIDLDSQELQDFSSELASDLGLSKSSTEALNDVLNRHGRGGKHREPGFLWKVAGELATTLTEEEKARLFEKMDESDISLFGGQKGNMGQGGGGMMGGRGGRNSGGMGQGRGGRHGGGGMGQGHGGNNFAGGIYSILTDEQKEAFKVIIDSYQEKFQAIKDQVDEGTLTQDEAWAQIQALREAMQAEMEALLTDEQKAELEQMKADREAEMEAYMDSSKAVMYEVLAMTAEQITEFENIQDDTKAAMEALREQLSNGDIDIDAFREAAVQMHTDASTKLEALFTDDQLEIIKIHKALQLRMNKHRGGGNGQGMGNGGRRGGHGRGGNSG